MGKHVFTLSLTVDIQNDSIPDGESVHRLSISSDTLYSMISNLRNSLISEVEELTAQEFSEAMQQANEFNGVLAKLEQLGVIDNIEDELPN